MDDGFGFDDFADFGDKPDGDFYSDMDEFGLGSDDDNFGDDSDTDGFGEDFDLDDDDDDSCAPSALNEAADMWAGNDFDPDYVNQYTETEMLDNLSHRYGRGFASGHSCSGGSSSGTGGSYSGGSAADGSSSGAGHSVSGGGAGNAGKQTISAAKQGSQPAQSEDQKRLIGIVAIAIIMLGGAGVGAVIGLIIAAIANFVE